MKLQPVSMAHALPLLAPAMARGDTTAGAAGLAELLHGSQAYTLDDDLCYALKVTQHEKCRVLWVMAAAAGGRAGRDMTGHGLDAIHAQAKSLDAAQVAITTRRPGLIKKLVRHGYTVTGITLRKSIP